MIQQVGIFMDKLEFSHLVSNQHSVAAADVYM